MFGEKCEDCKCKTCTNNECAVHNCTACATKAFGNSLDVYPTLVCTRHTTDTTQEV